MTKEPPYRLDACYPLHLLSDKLDKRITEAVGQKRGSSGGGVTGRDLNFYFWTKGDRDAAAERLSSANLMMVSVVRREELDPLLP